MIDNNIIMRSKPHFESILSYKAEHQNQAATLFASEEFSSIFADVNQLAEHVGTNKIQLRRISAIISKGYYQLPMYLENLRMRREELGFSFAYDDDGKIIVTADSCSDIITAFLDHRLVSRLSENTYDVQNTSRVG